MMKKHDVLLGLVLLGLALVLFAGMKYFHSEPGSKAVVKVDGEVFGVYDLSKDREITVQTKYGTNKLVIQGGKVHMEEADCPDGYCKRQGKIRRESQTIVCLPHKLVVEIHEK